MVIDWRKNAGNAGLFHVIDLATGEPLKARYLFYADDDKAVYRTADLDARGLVFLRSVATQSRFVSGGGRQNLPAVFEDGTSVVASG